MGGSTGTGSLENLSLDNFCELKTDDITETRRDNVGKILNNLGLIEGERISIYSSPDPYRDKEGSYIEKVGRYDRNANDGLSLSTINELNFKNGSLMPINSTYIFFNQIVALHREGLNEIYYFNVEGNLVQ